MSCCTMCRAPHVSDTCQWSPAATSGTAACAISRESADRHSGTGQEALNDEYDAPLGCPDMRPVGAGRLAESRVMFQM